MVDFANYDLRVGRGASDQFDGEAGALLDLDYFTPASGGGVVTNLSVTDASDTLDATALLTVGVSLSLTDTADALTSSALVEVVTDLSVSDTADALSADATVPTSGGVVCDLSVTDTSDTLASDALVSIAIDLSVTDTADTLASAVLVAVVADASNTDTADTLASTAGVEVLADLSVTDADDTLSSDVSIPVAGGVVCTLDVTDEADSLAADCTITGDAVEDAVSLGGRDKLKRQDVPFRRVKADLSVTDDSDQLYAAAKVSQLMKRIANLAVIDSDDTMDASVNAYWVQPTLIRNRQVKLVSSRYEAVTL